MGLARDIIDQAQNEVTRRAPLERTWELIANLVFLHPDRRFRRGSISTDRDAMEGWATGSKVAERAAKIYDITGITAAERLTTGMISITTPDNEKWQGLKADDPFGYELNDAELRWAESVRDYLFAVRYDPRSGWSLAHQASIRSIVTLGTGAYIIEEGFGKNRANPVQVPWTCTNLPMSDNYFTVNGQGFHDQDYRFITMSYRAAAGLFGDQLSKDALAKANNKDKCNDNIQLIHYVGERQDNGPLASLGDNMPVASVYIEQETEHIVRRGGFGYWPIVVNTWNQMTSAPYGESPVMMVLAEIASAQVLAKNTLLAAQQHTRPPIGRVDDSSMGRPNLNPGADNIGALDAQGNLKMKPIFTTSNPQLSQVVLEGSRGVVKEGMYTNLWQILINNPDMTATEALIRANEKGELMGPVGTRIQHGLSRLTDAELTILAQKGAFAESSPLAYPQSLGGRSITVKFQSPLDRLRRGNEVVAIQQTLGMASALVQSDPTNPVFDNFDGDEIVAVTREIAGAPSRILRKKEDRDALRDQRSQQNQIAAAQQMADVAKTGAEAAAKGVPAIQGLGDILGQYAA